jgi:hypothetical protein
MHVVSHVICNAETQDSVILSASEITTLVKTTTQDLSKNSVGKREKEVRISYSVVQLVIISSVFLNTTTIIKVTTVHK